MTIWRWRGLILAVCGLAGLGACEAMEYDLNDAVLEITTEGQTERVLQHEPGRSEVSITPPNSGRFTATFVYLDPSAKVSIKVDEESVAEQHDLSFPLDDDNVALKVEFGSAQFDASNANAQGVLSIERLDSDAEVISFRGIFQGTVASDEGNRAAVNGFIDAYYSGDEGF